MKVTTYAPRHRRAYRPFFAPAFRHVKNVKNAAVNVAENEDAFRLEIAAPGWSKDDFNIEVDQDVLTVSAEKEVKEDEVKPKYLRKEFGTGTFKRRFSLPDTVDAQAIKAEYVNGILEVTLPKKEEAKPQPARKIEIN